jgi:hypothetical protein
MDSVTILRARAPRVLAKRILAVGVVQDFDRPRFFSMTSRPVSGLDDVATLLRDLVTRPDSCVVRGGIADPARTQWVRRLIYPDQQTGDQPTLKVEPRRWLALDFDAPITLPGEVDRRDLAGCARVALAALRLPPAFDGAACIVQATAGHGIKPGARLRLWFWLGTPLDRAGLLAWFDPTIGKYLDPKTGKLKPLLDYSVFGAAQPIYTAGPIFEGRPDHLRERLVMLPGRPVVEVPPGLDTKRPPPGTPIPSVPRPKPKPRPGGGGGGRRYAAAALRNATVRVAGAPESARHATALLEACGLARFVERGEITEAEAIRAMDGGLVLAGKPAGEGASLVRWALSRGLGHAAQGAGDVFDA